MPGVYCLGTACHINRALDGKMLTRKSSGKLIGSPSPKPDNSAIVKTKT